MVTTQFCSPGGEPSKPQYWGAIAVSPGTMHSGDGWNFSGKHDASARAIKECTAAGGRDCIVVTTAANDFDHTAGAATFAALDTANKLVTVAITDDPLTEASETFNVNLSGAVNATIADNAKLP